MRKHESGAKVKLNLFALGYTLILSFLTLPRAELSAHSRVPSLAKMFMGQKGRHKGHRRKKNTLSLLSLRSTFKVGEIT